MDMAVAIMVIMAPSGTRALAGEGSGPGVAWQAAVQGSAAFMAAPGVDSMAVAAVAFTAVGASAAVMAVAAVVDTVKPRAGQAV